MVDMSLEAITERLDQMASLSRARTLRPSVDMSSEAVTVRLESMAALSAMCRELVAAGRASGLGRPAPVGATSGRTSGDSELVEARADEPRLGTQER